MKRSAKTPSCSFGNSDLKRWLLKIGPARRILLLKKFKENLVHLGLPRLAVRKGLLQLASCPIVRLNRLAVRQIRRKNRMKGPKSRSHRRPRSSSKERERPLDNNNNCNNCVSQEYSPTTSAFCNSKHTQEVRRDRSEKLDKRTVPSSKHSSLGEVAITEKERCREKESRSTPRNKREKRRHGGSHSRRKDAGENPYGIPWRLVSIDMKDPAESRHPGPEVRKQQMDKKKKKDRLLAKFLEIFGEDVEPDPPAHRVQTSETEATIDEDVETEAKDLETAHRKSPVLCNTANKRKRKHDRDTSKSESKKCKPANVDNLYPSTNVVDNTSGHSNSDVASTPIGGEIAVPLPHEISITVTTSTASIHPQPTETLQTAEEKSDTADAASTNADKDVVSDSRPDYERRSNGSTCECLRTESVIVGPDKIPSESPSIGQVKTETVSALPSGVKHEAEFTQEDGTTDSILEDNFPKNPIPAQPRICLKHESVEPPLNGFEGFQPHVDKRADCFDDGINPSSTTDTLPSPSVSCVNDRLLGALDNICLALHCRRRVEERQKTANKLAIKRNRQEEILKAHHELESRMTVFREELRFLSSRLETWKAVIRFICEGLEHRTPADFRPFSESEIEAAVIEADVKIRFDVSEQKESPEAIPKSNTTEKIICEIDLTEDDDTIDLCDSSTDPPKFPMKHSTFNSKLDCGDKTEDSQVPNESLTPSIAEVMTISPQQFETIGDRLSSPICVNPCFFCSLPSLVACGLCGKANYCSKSCQELDWEQYHHITCVPSEAVIRFTK